MRIDDIAKAAGVSTATVSRVINKNYPVSEQTRARVEEAINRLGYRPNIFARGLMNSRSDSVGIIVTFISNPYHMQIVNSIESVLSRNDIFIYLCCSNNDPDLEREYVKRLFSRNVDALIVVEGYSMNSRRNLYLEVEAEHPVILVNEHLALDTEHHIVRCAQEPGFLDALSFLRGAKLDSIALLRGKRSYSFDLKEQMFKKFVADNGFDPHRNPVVRLEWPNEPEAVREAAEVLRTFTRGKHMPQAVIASNDLIAIGVLQEALAAGIRVPQELKIISVDNTLVSQISSPRLSAVDLRMDLVGKMAADAYLRLRDRGFAKSEGIRDTIDSQLVLRETT